MTALDNATKGTPAARIILRLVMQFEGGGEAAKAADLLALAILVGSAETHSPELSQQLVRAIELLQDN